MKPMSHCPIHARQSGVCLLLLRWASEHTRNMRLVGIAPSACAFHALAAHAYAADARCMNTTVFCIPAHVYKIVYAGEILLLDSSE